MLQRIEVAGVTIRKSELEPAWGVDGGMNFDILQNGSRLCLGIAALRLRRAAMDGEQQQHKPCSGNHHCRCRNIAALRGYRCKHPLHFYLRAAACV
jgi:hypothetical protein